MNNSHEEAMAEYAGKLNSRGEAPKNAALADEVLDGIHGGLSDLQEYLSGLATLYANNKMDEFGRMLTNLPDEAKGMQIGKLMDEVQKKIANQSGSGS